MKDKFDKEFSNDFSDEFLASPPPVEEEVVKKAPVKTKIKLYLLNGVNGLPAGKVLCVDEAGNGYLVPVEVAPQSHKDVREFAQDDKDLEALYNWDKEIGAMLPSREAMVKTVRLSLYRSGAFARGDLNRNAVKQQGLKTAFPYTISELEE